MKALDKQHLYLEQGQRRSGFSWQYTIPLKYVKRCLTRCNEEKNCGKIGAKKENL
jgi:hypothetical protein